MLEKFIRHGIIWIENGAVEKRIEVSLPNGNALYGFKQDLDWLYFGSAKNKVESLISSYINHQRNIISETTDPTLTRKRRKMHHLFTQYLQRMPVEIWAAPLGSEQVEMLGDYPIHMRLGIENGLICKFKPPLNEDTILREC